ADVGEAELLERHGREVEHARAAGLLHAVDVVDVLAGPGGDAAARLGEHLLALAVAQRVGRAGLDARRRDDALEEAVDLLLVQRLAVARRRRRLSGAVRAVGALVDLRRERVPVRRRHAPRTRPHAVAAADALRRVVRDRP